MKKHELRLTRDDLDAILTILANSTEFRRTLSDGVRRYAADTDSALDWAEMHDFQAELVGVVVRALRLEPAAAHPTGVAPRAAVRS